MSVRDIVKRFEDGHNHDSSLSRTRPKTISSPNGSSSSSVPMPASSPARFIHPLLKPSIKSVSKDDPFQAVLQTDDSTRGYNLSTGRSPGVETISGVGTVSPGTVRLVQNTSASSASSYSIESVICDGLPLKPLKRVTQPSPLQQSKIVISSPLHDWKCTSQDTLAKDEGNPPPSYSTRFVISPRTQSFSPKSVFTASDDIKADILSRNPHDSHDSHDALIPSSALSSTAVPYNNHKKLTHVPIAAKTIFSRGAAPLSLPALDEFLSSFPAPKFSSYQSRNPRLKGKQKAKEATPFPPMELLAATGRSIDELEKNSTIPSWFLNRASIFNSIASWFVGTLGSSALVSYYSLNGLYDSLQIFALLLSTFIDHDDVINKWRNLFLGTIPNILALNFARTSISLILFVILIAVSGLLVYIFRRSVCQMYATSRQEGFQGKDKSSEWAIVSTALFLTVVYLPMSTMAVHALVWSDDFWPRPTSGPLSAPHDVCYTTTLEENEVNFAPVIIMLSIFTFIFLTIGFPILLIAAIRQTVPHVDKYTELGRPRSHVEMNHEYQRLLDRDQSALAFLYRDLRWGWGTYKPAYFVVKLSTLLIVAVLDTDNCLFLGMSDYTISMVRQALLVVAMSTFLVIHSILTPFIDPVNNASEWVSRAGYVAFAVLGLIGSLNIPSAVQDAFNGPILYVVYIINYTFTFYFAFINLGWSLRLVKKIFKRIDFSIDIFSPDLDISPNSRHIRRRIWQETISILLLATPECAMTEKQQLNFAEAENAEYPPYLLEFSGTAAERHVENLKILREIGGMGYAKGVAIWTATCHNRLIHLQDQIQKHHIGPDSYWQKIPASEGYFGNAWWIPFPPTLVMKYDSGEVAVLTKLDEFEAYIQQNEDILILEKRQIRTALRSLDGKVVKWPYTHTELIGSKFPWCQGRRYTAQLSTDYESCVLSIKHKGSLPWKGFELGSGFDIELTYSPDVKIDGSALGITDAYEMTPPLAEFFRINQKLLYEYLPLVETAIGDYRRCMRKQMRDKHNVLTYQFLSNVYCSPKEMPKLTKVVDKQEKNLRVRQMFVEYEDAINAANERMSFVSQAEVSTWWYLYWDDLWRRNHDVISQLQTYASDFDPHYPTSIAYRLLSRPVLETFLTQRGLFKPGGKSGFIYSGVMNKLYFRLNQIVFRGSSKIIQYHLGEASFEIDLESLTDFGHTKSSTLGTGGGTDYDDEEIRPRPLYRWEDIFDDPISRKRSTRWLPKLAVWLGLSPYWHSYKARTKGVSLDLRLEDGSYVMLDREVDKLKETVS